MFSKTIVLSALAAIAAAQSSVLTFTNVPNPITDGQAQAITYATNDTSSVCDRVLFARLKPTRTDDFHSP